MRSVILSLKKRKLNILKMITSLEKRISHINTYMWNLEKMVLMNLCAGQEWRLSHEEWTCGPIGDGKGGISWESGTDVHELPRVKWIAGRNLLCGTGLSSVLCDNLG